MQITDKPKVSVLLSVFNGEKTLERCIESVLNQTYGDFEFFIINDGSSDRTAEIASKSGVQEHTHTKNMGKGEA